MGSMALMDYNFKEKHKIIMTIKINTKQGMWINVPNVFTCCKEFSSRLGPGLEKPRALLWQHNT